MAAGSSGPWGGAVLARVVKDVAQGWPAGLTVLTGDDLFHLDRAQRAILGALVSRPSDPFACTVFGDTPVAIGDVVGAVRSTGMFASRRVVLVRDVAALQGEPEPLLALAQSPPRDGYLLVRAPKLDRKRKLGKALAEAPRCLVFRAAGEREAADLARAIADLARERGVTLDREGIALLIEVCGGDLLRAEKEIEKLEAWLGDEPTGRRAVDLATLRSLLAGAALLSGWELSTALLARDRTAALEAARRLLDAGEEPIRIVGGLAWRARTLLKAKAMAESGASPREVVTAARAWSQERELTQSLKLYGLDELLAMPGKLLGADRDLKSRSIDPRSILERLVVDLIPAAPGRAR